MGIPLSRTTVTKIKIYPTGIMKKKKNSFTSLMCCKNRKTTNTKITHVSFKSFRGEKL